MFFIVRAYNPLAPNAVPSELASLKKLFSALWAASCRLCGHGLILPDGIRLRDKFTAAALRMIISNVNDAASTA